MKQFKMILAVVILISSIFLLFSKIFTPQPIQIVLETGQEITSQTPNNYSLTDVLLLVVTSFFIGATSIYLFYNSDRLQDLRRSVSGQEKLPQKELGIISNLLKSDEKKVFSELKENNGEMLQNKLVEKTGLSKVAMTRALVKLEHKSLILKERHGLTNKIKLKV